MTLLKYLVLSLVGFILLCLCSQEIAYHTAWNGHLAAVREAYQERLPSYLRAQELVSRETLFAYGDSHNASELINDRIRWPASGGGLGTLADSHTQIPLPHFKPKRPGIQVPEVPGWSDVGLYDTTSYNLSWFEQLGKYDYWELRGSPRFRQAEALLRQQRVSMYEYLAHPPLPNFADLVQLARMRVLQSIVRGTVPTALAEIHHLASLVYSTETLPGALVAVDLLSLEQNAREYAARNLGLRVKTRNALELDPATIKQAVVGSLGFYSALSSAELVVQAMPNPRAAIGQCAAIMDGLKTVVRIYPLVERTFPLERRWSPLLETLKNTALQSQCRIPVARAYWAEPWAVVPANTHGALYWLEHVPFIRRVAALYLLTHP